MLLAVSARTGQGRSRDELTSLLLGSSAVVHPQPLGDAAVASLVREVLGPEAGEDLCRACAEATGGNPFLVSELLGEFRRTGGWHATSIPPMSMHLFPSGFRHRS